MAVDPEITALLARYNEKLNEPLNSAKELTDNPPLLAHYTSIQVAEQIIRNEEIWLSHPFYMNDLEELRFGMQLGLQLFPAFAQSVQTTPQRTKMLLDAFGHYVGYMNENTLVDTYVLCLSEHAPGNTDGILSMWRSYASQGHGAALVFNTRGVQTDPPQAPLWIAKVTYLSTSDRVEMMRDALQRWADMPRAENLPDDRVHLAAYAAFYFVRSFALVTKHRGFAEEREWRVVYLKDLDPENLLAGQLSYHLTARGAEPKMKFKIRPVRPGGTLSLASILTLFCWDRARPRRWRRPRSAEC